MKSRKKFSKQARKKQSAEKRVKQEEQEKVVLLKHEYKIPFGEKEAKLLQGKKLFMDEGKKNGNLYIFFNEPNSDDCSEVQPIFNSDGTCDIPIPKQFLGCPALLYDKITLSFCNRGIKISPGKIPPEEDLY